jgi:tetratricopeptide (TPR) repeat protein
MSLDEAGKYEEAEQIYRRYLDITAKVQHAEHTGPVMRNLANLLRKLGRDAEADEFMEKLCHSIPPDDLPLNKAP